MKWSMRFTTYYSLIQQKMLSVFLTQAIRPRPARPASRPAAVKPEEVYEIPTTYRDRRTPIRSRQASTHTSPLSRLQFPLLQEPTPQFAYEHSSPLRKELMTPIDSAEGTPINRVLFDEESTQADFLSTVYSRRHIKSPVIERINVDLHFPVPPAVPKVG
jgi:hypothetical protein